MDTRKFFEALQSDVKGLDGLRECLGITVNQSPFETVLAEKIGIASSDLIYNVPWDNLVKLFGEPIEKLTLDHELFRAFAESERWLNDAAAFLCDDFEEKYHKAANLLINYFWRNRG